MTRVNSTDHVLLLLRERLQRLPRGRGSAAGRAAGASGKHLGPMERLQALAMLDDVSPDELSRSLVRAVLAEGLGEGLSNDPAFQAVVADVFRIISASPEGKDLIDRAARQLRAT